MTRCAPCAHIADYYDAKQAEHQCIGHNLLRHGYRQWAEGRVDDPTTNNLYTIHTPESLAEHLIGTCSNFPIPQEVFQSEADLMAFDALAFVCDCCGWWCSTDELNNETSRDFCDQCKDDDE